MSIAVYKDHAVIHTATIDVKTIRLNKRQVTMSVFRQLDEETIFNVDGTLAGIPWGRVNYTWKDNRLGTDYHIVWQDGDMIKRSSVPSIERAKNWWLWVVDNDSWASLYVELATDGFNTGFQAYEELRRFCRWSEEDNEYEDRIRYFADRIGVSQEDVDNAENWEIVGMMLIQKMCWYGEQLEKNVLAMKDLDQLFIAT